MIDWNHVQQLRVEIGADAFDEVVDLFLDEVDAAIGRLRDLPDGHDPEEQLHFLRGSALNLGFSEFSGLCHQGEIAAASGQGDAVDLTGLLRCYEASRTAFMEGLRQARENPGQGRVGVG
ncbi:Hpt domain-containing protein [Roseovarius azorensis]|uniref:Hpt domain-containing protein n=1 Tax=Roseovarius azorensis TaxID=1287727 RepID=A0A1H7KDF6_9RHOB|nr:Hpt domain-containing protein [Roseovarius azorensis]SEK84839.1 Hpt domain-containing protein [Roseovarius azorensis]